MKDWNLVARKADKILDATSLEESSILIGYSDVEMFLPKRMSLNMGGMLGSVFSSSEDRACLLSARRMDWSEDEDSGRPRMMFDLHLSQSESSWMMLGTDNEEIVTVFGDSRTSRHKSNSLTLLCRTHTLKAMV